MDEYMEARATRRPDTLETIQEPKESLTEKINRACKLFDEIKSMFPDSNVNMNIHNLDLRGNLEGWNIEPMFRKDNKRCYLVANRGKGEMDITLFSEDYTLKEGGM